MDIIYGMLGGGIVSVLCVIAFLGLPKLVGGILLSKLDSTIQNALAETNAKYEIELEKIKAENQRELQIELEAIKLENTKKINAIQLQFQNKYQNTEHDFNKRIDLLKMKYTVLPMLYEKLVEAYSYVHLNNFVNFDDRLAVKNKIKNLDRLILINKFYLSEDIFKDFIDCKNKIIDLFVIKEEIAKNNLEDTYNGELPEKYSSEDESYSQLFDELSKKISEEMV